LPKAPAHPITGFLDFEILPKSAFSKKPRQNFLRFQFLSRPIEFLFILSHPIPSAEDPIEKKSNTIRFPIKLCIPPEEGYCINLALGRLNLALCQKKRCCAGKSAAFTTGAALNKN
jgi:hypothetical protein